MGPAVSPCTGAWVAPWGPDPPGMLEIGRAMNRAGEDHVQVHGVRLAVQRHAIGEGRAARTMVFLHDSLGCITTWRDFPQVLGKATGRDVLIYDRQGYGRSDPFGPTPRQADYMHREADALHELLEAEDIAQAILFGHSDGGTIALLAAASHPQSVSAVITEGAHVFVEEVTLNGIRAAERAWAGTDPRQRLLKHHGGRTEALATEAAAAVKRIVGWWSAAVWLYLRPRRGQRALRHGARRRAHTAQGGPGDHAGVGDAISPRRSDHWAVGGDSAAGVAAGAPVVAIVLLHGDPLEHVVGLRVRVHPVRVHENTLRAVLHVTHRIEDRLVLRCTGGPPSV